MAFQPKNEKRIKNNINFALVSFSIKRVIDIVIRVLKIT
jgi:hypothetical protein